MRNFQDTFQKHKRSFISVFSICMTVPLSVNAIRNNLKLLRIDRPTAIALLSVNQGFESRWK